MKCRSLTHLVLSSFHTGLGHASPPFLSDTATARNTYLYDCWGILWTQATPSAIPAGATPPTNGQRRLSPTTVPWQRGAVYAVSPLQEGDSPDAHAQGQRQCS